MSQAMNRKQQLLKRHRRNKRIGLLVALVLLICLLYTSDAADE